LYIIAETESNSHFSSSTTINPFESCFKHPIIA